MNNNQFKPVVGRVYQYSGNTYRCVSLDNRFKLNGQWYDGVLYEPEDKNGKANPNQIYARTQEDWMANFIPAYIEPKDYIISESMGKILGIYEVQEAQYGGEVCARNIETNNDDYLTFEHLEIQSGCRVIVKHAGDIEYLRNNALFFLISEEYKNYIFQHSKTLADAKSEFMRVTRKFRRLDDLDIINRATRMLESLLNSDEA